MEHVMCYPRITTSIANENNPCLHRLVYKTGNLNKLVTNHNLFTKNNQSIMKKESQGLTSEKRPLKGLEHPQTVVHCDTEEKATQVLKIAHEAGYDGFSDGTKYLEDNKYERYKEDTCYQIKQGWYSGLEYYSAQGYKIITAEEVIKANSEYLSNKELLEIANRDYGLGVQFKSIETYDKEKVRIVAPYYDHRDCKFKICTDPKRSGARAIRFENGINTSDGGCSNPAIYVDGVGWAEIVSKPTVKEVHTSKSEAMLTRKEDVYVVLDTPEKVRQFYSVLVQANEPMYFTSKEYWGRGVVKSFNEAYICDGEWMGCGERARIGRTEASIEQLAEILNVNISNMKTETVTFKVGDRVRIVRAFEDGREDISMRKEMYTLIGKEGVIISAHSYQKTVFVDVPDVEDGRWTWFADCLELITEPETTQDATIINRKVSRESLAAIYQKVCSGWQSTITSLLVDADPFSNEVEVPEDLVKKAYQDANDEQLKWLKLHLPAPKKIETVEVVKWAVLSDDRELVKGTYGSEGDARQAARGNTVVELKGSYTVEVEDEEYSFDMPF